MHSNTTPSASNTIKHYHDALRALKHHSSHTRFSASVLFARRFFMKIFHESLKPAAHKDIPENDYDARLAAIGAAFYRNTFGKVATLCTRRKTAHVSGPMCMVQRTE